MPRYIVVTGGSDAGKTSTIRTLWSLLGGNKLPDTPSDFHAMLVYEEKNIGFHSWGDTEYYLNEHAGGIPDLEKNCDIIISAAKSRGQTQEYFNERCKISKLYWVGKVWQSEKNKSLKQAAAHVKILINALVRE